MLNDCYKYYATTEINAANDDQPFPAEPLIMELLLFSQHKMTDWLIKVISKYESLLNDNNNKQVKESKQQEHQLMRKNTNDYIRKGKRIHNSDD